MRRQSFMRRHRLLATLAPAAIVGVLVLVVLAVWAGLPTRPPAGTPKPSPTPTPNPAMHAFPALEARLPSTVAGHVLNKESLPSDPEHQTPATLEVLRRLNRQPGDIQLARASVSGVNLSVAAMRIVGADAVQAALAFEAVDGADSNGATTYEPAQVAGRRVLIRRTATIVEYVYPLDDVLFTVSGDFELVAEALAEIR